MGRKDTDIIYLMTTVETQYWWIRIFDYKYERDKYDKGVLLDEFYYDDIEKREQVKERVLDKYTGETKLTLQFAKPRKKDNVYAIVMESNKFFYDRMYKTIDTFCFMCHKHIVGKEKDFTRYYEFTEKALGDDMDHENYIYYCSYDCKNDYFKIRNPLFNEGEFQSKQSGECGEIFGYIYLIYNRIENVYYIGQTRFMPFFRWQEHTKSKDKGNILDLSYSTITEVRNNNTISDVENQKYLNSIEAWWIGKYKEEGYKVFNITKPKITIVDLRKRYDEMISKQMELDKS